MSTIDLTKPKSKLNRFKKQFSIGKYFYIRSHLYLDVLKPEIYLVQILQSTISQWRKIKIPLSKLWGRKKTQK